MIHKVLEVCRKLPLKVGPMPNPRYFVCAAVGGARATQWALLRVPLPLRPGQEGSCAPLWGEKLPEMGGRRGSPKPREAEATQGNQICSIWVSTQVFSISRIVLKCNPEACYQVCTIRFLPEGHLSHRKFNCYLKKNKKQKNIKVGGGACLDYVKCKVPVSCLIVIADAALFKNDSITVIIMEGTASDNYLL